MDTPDPIEIILAKKAELEKHRDAMKTQFVLHSKAAQNAGEQHNRAIQRILALDDVLKALGYEAPKPPAVEPPTPKAGPDA